MHCHILLFILDKTHQHILGYQNTIHLNNNKCLVDVQYLLISRVCKQKCLYFLNHSIVFWTKLRFTYRFDKYQNKDKT